MPEQVDREIRPLLTQWTMALAMLLLCLCLSPSASAEPFYTFGVVPQQSASKLARQWAPVFRFISERSGIKLRFATAPSIPVFEARMRNGLYDFAYMNPYHYTVFNSAPGYVAFAKQRDKRIVGLMVVAADSPYTSMSDLRNNKLAFPSPMAFAASLLPRAYLSQQKIPFTARYVNSHDSVYRAVAQGLYPAGGGIERTLNSVDPEVRKRLRVLWRSAPFTPHAFAAHPRVPPEVVAAVREAMIAMGDDLEGRKLLAPLRFKGIDAARDQEWDDVRTYGMDLLEKLVGG